MVKCIITCSNFGRCIYEYNDIVYICLYSLFMNYKLLVITIIDIISLVLQSKSLLMTYNVINYKFIISIRDERQIFYLSLSRFCRDFLACRTLIF